MKHEIEESRHVNAQQDDIVGLAEQLQTREEFNHLTIEECVVIVEKRIGDGETTSGGWKYNPPAEMTPLCGRL